MAEDPKPQQPQAAAGPEPVVEPAATEHTSAESPPPTADAPAAATAAPAAASALPPVPDTGYTPAGVPTLEGVREKIETRFGTALGATELAEDTPEGKTAAQQFEARQKAAEDKLEEIRASMHKSD